MNLISLEEVERYVDMYFTHSLRRRTNKRNNVYKRVVFTCLALENAKYLDSKKKVRNFNLTDIAVFLGGFNHATIIHYRDNLMDMLLEYEEAYRSCYNDFQTYLTLKSEYYDQRIEKLPTKRDIELFKKRLYFQAETDEEFEFMKRRIDHAQKVMPNML